MDTSSPANDKASGAQSSGKSSIDSLRTVEFRTTLRGYHMDDVDEYLERVAVEAESLQEQVRLASDRVRQAGERVTSLEQQLEAARRAQQALQAQKTEQADQDLVPAAQTARAEQIEITDDSLQRTLLLAQKFVDQTKQEAEDEARSLVSQSETRARNIVADAEEHVRVMTEDAERNLRDEVAQLKSVRDQLASDIDSISRQLDTERARIRKALTEMLDWVDEHVQPKKATDPPKEAAPSAQQGSGTGGSRLQKDGSDDDVVAAALNTTPTSTSSARPVAAGEAPLSQGEQAGRSWSAEASASPGSGSETSRVGREPREQTDLLDPRRGVADRDDHDQRSVRGDRGQRIDSSENALAGPPTKRIPTLSSEGQTAGSAQFDAAAAVADDDDDEAPLTTASGRESGSSERPVPTQQREMFAPGRESHQAGSRFSR
jgi:cell division initiation protein